MTASKVAIELRSKGGSDKKLSTADLKTYLKEKSMSQAGDKPTLWHRAKLQHTVTSEGLSTAEGDNPTTLKPAGLRKACARAGLSPIGSNDELLTVLVEHLSKEKRKGGGLSSSSSSSTTKTTNPSAKLNPIALAERVLELADDAVGNPICILKLADPKLVPEASTAVLRKAYLKMSLAIHPDRIGRSFKEATKSFQVLVTAFEALTRPDTIPSGDDEGGGGGGKSGKGSGAVKIARSNEGCFRTAVHCPRCKQPWGEKVEGNPDWFYNVMMMGKEKH